MDELNLGKRIRSLRTKKNMSLRDLAKLSNITPSMLSQIENDQATPSIKTLRIIADGLSIPVYCLFRTEQRDDIVVRRDQRPVMGQQSDTDAFYELLVPDNNGQLSFSIIHLPPHAYSTPDGRSHRGEEVAYIISGEAVEVEIDAQTYELYPGDSVRIPAGTFHRYYNPSCKDAEVIFALDIRGGH